jgi:hypothetical protein
VQPSLPKEYFWDPELRVVRVRVRVHTCVCGAEQFRTRTDITHPRTISSHTTRRLSRVQFFVILFWLTWSESGKSPSFLSRTWLSAARRRERILWATEVTFVEILPPLRIGSQSD